MLLGEYRAGPICTWFRCPASCILVPERRAWSTAFVPRIRSRLLPHVSHDCTVSLGVLFYVPKANKVVYRAKNIQTVLIARFLQGAFGSTGSTMVCGTIADIWSPSE